MKQDGVQEWIREHAAIEHKSKYGRYTWKAPKIWMVTAVQHVTGGVIRATSNALTKIGGAAGADAGAAVNAPPGALRVKAEANYEHSTGASNDFGHEDERVWAAQFMPVTIHFGYDEDRELSAKEHAFLPKTIASFRLEDVPDLEMKGIRSGGTESDGRPARPVPKLIGRITVQTPTEDNELEEDDDFVIDPYVTNKKDTDWEQYDEYKTWLKE